MKAVVKHWLFSCLLVVSAGSYSDEYAQLDHMLTSVQSQISPELPSQLIQHSRLAHERGESLSPSIALLFSDPVINTRILQANPQAGLDLPFRLLFYTDHKGREAVSFTSSAFLHKRHNLSDKQALAAFDAVIADVTRLLPSTVIAPLALHRLTPGYGILQHTSVYDFETTLSRFEDEVIGNNDDTLWFGEIDYTADAARLGVVLPKMKLLMFGAPAPGAKAMADFKKLGLDAFCQKVLIIEEGDQVRLYSNDIVALARLHYDDNNLSHRIINFRLKQAYASIVE